MKDYYFRQYSQLLKEGIAKRMRDKHMYMKKKKLNPVYRYN